MTTTPRPIHRLLSLLWMALVASPLIIAAPQARAADFRSWAALGDYERTALAQASSFRMILPTRDGNRDVAFHPADVLADAYQAEVVDRYRVRTPLDRPDVRTFTGSVAPESGQRDFAKLAQLPDGRLAGLLRASGVLYDLRSDPKSENALLWVREIPAADVGRLLEGCALSLPANLVASGAPPSLPAADVREIELATEADARFFAQAGGADQANARIAAIVNAVNGFYESDLGLTHRIVVQRAWSGRDPYTSKNSEKLLSEFRDRFSNDISESYDAAQLFSGRNFEGTALGQSWVASACGSSRYGVNQARGLADSSIALLLAHQAAHTLGADHADAGLMATSQAADVTRFSDTSRSEIADYVSGASCLAPVLAQSPVLDPVGPQQIAEGEVLELQLTASDADGDSLVFDATPLPPGASISPEGRFVYAAPLDAVGCGRLDAISITLLVTDSSGSQASENVPILVSDRPTGATPELADPADVVVDAGQVVWIPLDAADADGDALTFSASSLPSGAYFDASGVFIWQPGNADAGLHVVSFVASDCAEHTSAQTVAIQVNPVPAPHLTSLTPSSGPDGTLVEIVGTGFAGTSVEVSFGTMAASIQAASVTSIVVQAPLRCDDVSSVDVVLRRDGITSDNSLTFTYLGAKTGGETCRLGASSRR